MSIHKLTAGSGYDYLTRQVAALDATDKGHTGLAGYYTERGETPGVWAGAGLAGIDGLAAGDVVTAEQMQALFGSGHHPLAAQRRAALEAAADQPGTDAETDADYRSATRLGVPYKVYDNDVSAFRVEVAHRVAGLNAADGLPADWPVPAAQRARIRTEVAREFFAAEHGRQAADAREIAAVIARHSRPHTTAVAGYDLTFSPVKSVSALWAVADPATAAKVEQAHQAAVADALRFLEAHALFTRTGTNGVRQVDVRGLVATAFTHRDSRAGDPDLHTHVAVANKVQTLDGRWLAIDGRVLFKANVAASETYNTALESHLLDALGLRFAERPNPDARKRPVREVVGVDPALNQRWSARRASIETRRGELAAAFQATHARPPTPVESLRLAQRATLETREAKHEPRTLAEQRASWHTQAVHVLGGDRQLRKMLRRTLAPGPVEATVPDGQWFSEAAGRVLAAMEARRSTWQTWHVRAEAQRQVRAAAAPTQRVDRLVDALVAEVLHTRSVSLAPPSDGIEEPAPLRRADGASVYTVAGAHLFTSARVVEAERRLVATAGRAGGAAVDQACVDLALLESAANGLTLNAGQAALVREMATCGARLQLGIAPAGSGKTTAMRALATAWAEGGGTVIGLAPSAAAAAALGESLGAKGAARTDTLAKLTWSLSTGDWPEWVARIGPSTLVIIDEAAMADTLSLDAAVRHVVDRGGSVRLVGDDQQLAAIGAGGVLRDIETSHGALRLVELMRFADSGEGAASLALREGHTEAIGFYLDRDRVHVGDLATMTEDVFAGWQADRARGLDAVMLAPTRELTSELNQRARAHRLHSASPPRRTLRLGDGNDASVGELIITRANDRRLRTSATDWVKNGDRWTILAIHRAGALTARHTQTGRTVRLPPDYVADATELGYATTVHTAQGVTADTMHGLAGGGESRQQLYTMLTRGRVGNHVYLEVVGDGDPHSVISPEVVHPPTATDLLEAILARDDAPRSATTLLRAQADPAARLGAAAARYLDALYLAAADVAGADVAETLDAAAESVVPGLSGEAAWPALRAHLLLLGAHGEDPLPQLRAAAGEGDLGTAADKAAVLDWRLDESGLRNTGPGPLPWMPAIPPALVDHPQWGGYLHQRAQLVQALSEQVHADTLDADAVPAWARNGTRPDPTTRADVAVWRAATGVDPGDRRPTGPAQMQKAAARWQRSLNRRVTGEHTPALREWGDLLRSLSPAIGRDDFTPLLADRLAAISRAGLDTPGLLRSAHTAGALPDDHPAAALWWRLSRRLSPAVATGLRADDHTLTTAWTPQLADLLGARRAATIQASPWWPALITTIDHGLARGWRLADLLTPQHPTGADVDECQALVWRASIVADPPPTDHIGHDDYDPPPADLWHGVDPPADAITATEAAQLDVGLGCRPGLVCADVAAPNLEEVLPVAARIDAGLALAALARDLQVPPEPTDADTARMLARAAEWDHCPVTRQRMLEINEMAQRFFTDHFAGSWARTYLADRFGLDLHRNDDFRPGHAPPGWTALVHHLRRHGVTDTEMVATGVASTARTGRVIDRFRDRVMFPICHHGEILGFVGRRHPDHTDADKAGPKYLNTADTPLFHKGAQLFGGDQLLAGGAVPALVEGPMDAIAVTLATAGTHVGLAPLGTSLTDDQAAQLGHLRRDPVLATDADLAGRIAAERAYWMLTPYGLDPGYARFPTGSDPADLLAHRGPAALAAALVSAHPLGDELLTERLTNLPPHHARTDAARVLAARPAHAWVAGIDNIGDRLNIPADQIRRDLHNAVTAWDRDPRKTAQDALGDLHQTRQRLTHADTQPPAQRWAPLGAELDPRLPDQPDWPACAAMMQDAHDQGHDVAATSRRLLAEAPLGPRPAQDLRYRFVSRLDVDLATEAAAAGPATAAGASHERQTPPTPAPSPHIHPRR